MALGSDNGQTACSLDFVGKLDVGTTTCHVGGNGHGTLLTCMCNYLCLTGMLLGIEHLMLDSAHPQHSAQELGCLHVGCTDKDRTSFRGEFDNFVYDSLEFCLLCLVYQVVIVMAGYWSVGRDDNHVKFVDFPELPCLGLCSTGHTGKLVVHTEIVLESDGCKSLGCSLDLHVFLGLDSLMESVAPAPSLHDTAGLLIDNLDLAVFRNDIIDVLVKHRISLKELIHSVYAL